MNPVAAFILALLMWAAVFFIVAALIMVTYNNSIVKMNDSWKKIDYKVAMIFTLFLMFIFPSGYVYVAKDCY